MSEWTDSRFWRFLLPLQTFLLWAGFILDIVESRGVAVLAILFGAFVALGMWKNIRISTRNGF